MWYLISFDTNIWKLILKEIIHIMQVKSPFWLNLFIKFQIDLEQHIKIEEKTIFAYSDVLYKASISKSMQAVLLIHFSQYSISDFVKSHEDNECYLTEIIFILFQKDDLKNHPVYNILLKQICQLDNELKTHAWIEDNVLVKKVEEIESAISNFVKND